MSLDSLLPGAKDLGPRFALVGQLPTTLFALFVLALAWSGAPGDPPDVGRVVDRLNDLGAADYALLVVGVLAASILLQPFQFALVRLLEGYWGPSRASALIERPARDRQARRRQALVGRTQLRKASATPEETAQLGAAAFQLSLRYPAKGRLLATALGNVLRAAEDRAGNRYGYDTVVIWPRLYPILPDTMRAILDDQRTQLDLAARFAAVYGVAAPVSLAFLAGDGWWLLVPAVAVALAWLSYRGSIAAALVYGQTLEVAFDLHRFDLLKALQLPLPSTAAEELALATRLSDRLRQDADELDVTYAHAAPEELPSPREATG